MLEEKMDDRFTNMSSLLGALAKSLNLINAKLENHHERTAYLAYMIAREAGFDKDDLDLTIYAGLTHDIGSIVNEEPQSITEIEQQASQYAVTGAKLMSGFPGSEEVANIILHSQSSWNEYLSLSEERKNSVYRSARIASVVHLADTVSTMLQQDVPILQQAKSIRQLISSLSDNEFSSEATDAFMKVSEYDYIWLDLLDNPQFLRYFAGDIRPVSLDRTMELTAFLSRIIDYRSAFTAMHSAGVAASAEVLSKLCGMGEDDIKMMRIAGYLHDIGKLKVPRSILEKPGKLTEDEFNVIKEHPYYTRLSLMDVEGFDKIADWASFHHEKLNGKGYPFHFGASNLDTGSRIMAVADIFSAITETRPYRNGMDRKAAMDVLSENVHSGGIDGDIVALLNDNYEEINAAREETSRIEGARYYNSIQR